MNETTTRATTGPRRVVFLGPNRLYHARHSGYETLVRFLDTESELLRLPRSVDDGAKALSSLLTERWRSRVLGRIGLYWYGRRRIFEELMLLRPLLGSPGTIVHHLYGEESYRFSGYFPRRRGNALVATFHMPPSRFAQYVRDPTPIKRLDAVVALAQNQANFLREVAGHDRVFVVPHGVDTDFFTPARQPPEEFRCLCVGYWLRDFETLHRVVDRLLPDGIAFDLVSPGKLAYFRDRPGVSIWARLSDEELRALYQRASVFLLPTLDSTANNALMEAMACGLPVVATEIGGIPDYCDESNAILAPPRDDEALAAAILRLRDDGGLRRKLAERSRGRVMAEFDWRIVAQSMRQVYDLALRRSTMSARASSPSE